MIIAHITDTHIVQKEQSWLKMPETNISNRLKMVVEYLNKLLPLPDVVLLTGDATDSGDKKAYQYLKELLKPLAMPVYVIPGNHDHREEMRAAFSDTTYMPQEGFIQYVIDDYPVRLIALDTHVPGEDYGFLCCERLQWLECQLKTNPSKPTVLFMHHFPMKIGQNCIDNLLCRFAGEFEKLIQASPHVLGIVAGHYHKTSSTLFGGKICFIAPSVAPFYHFATDEDMHVTAIDLGVPSFALHRWTGKFQMISECVQVVKLKDRLPLSGPVRSSQN